MNCEEAARFLRTLLLPASAGDRSRLDSTEEAGLRDLLERGYVVRVAAPAGGADRLTTFRERLADLQGRAAALRRDIADEERVRGPSHAGRREALVALDRLEAEIRAARTSVLDLAEGAAIAAGSVEISGSRFVVSYRGRELLTSLAPRLRRTWSMDLRDFERELEETRVAFDVRAMTAARILRLVSPILLEIDEIHCRAASVGLAVRKEPAPEVATAFAQAMEVLKLSGVPRVPPEQRAVVAETLCLSQQVLDKEAIQAAVREYLELRSWVAESGPVLPDQLNRCALVLYPHNPSRRREILDGAWGFLNRTAVQVPARPPSLAAAVLVAGVSGGDPSRLESVFVGYVNEMPSKSGEGGEAALAAALLTLAGGPAPSEALARFRTASDYLARFSENGMEVPAAMLALQSPEVEEALDNLRLASAAISRHRLSLGGMENLSLGMKLLMETAITPGAAEGVREPSRELQAGPAPLGGIGIVGLAAAASVLVPALAVFHETGLHRLAIADEAFHPVHTHYVYG